MSERIYLSVWVPEGEDKVKLVYSDDEVVFVKKEDFNRAFGAIISAEKDDVIRDFAIKEQEGKIIRIHIKREIELNRAWIYGNGPDEEPTGETNFVIPEDYFVMIFDKLFPRENDISFFLEVYEPETDGEKIYQQAKKDGKIIEEFESKIRQ